MSPTKPPHFWASLENEIKNLIVFYLRKHAESMYFKQTYSCILHPKKKIKGTIGVEIKRKRNQESKGEIHHKIIVPFYEFFSL